MKRGTLEEIKEGYGAQVANPSFNLGDLFTGLPENENTADLRAWAISEGRKAKDFDAAAHRWKVTLALGDMPATSAEYVALYAKRRAWRLRFNGLIDTPADTINVSEAHGLLMLEAERLGLTFPERKIEIAFTHWRLDSRRTITADALVKVCASGAAMDWDRLAGAITDQTVTPLPLAVAALKAVVWQVKRRLAGLAIYDHAMVVFQGPQGGGKSQFVSKLAGPIEDMMLRADFAQITDKAFHDLWEYPLVFIDEMAGADRRDAAAIKEAITKDTHSGRVHYTHSANTIQCRHTLIAAMNGRLSDLIKDPTGMRRFCPIQFLPSPTRVAAEMPAADWDVVNSVDWLTAWQSIDHTGAHPLNEVRELWMAASEGEREIDSVEAWLRSAVERDSILDRELDPSGLRTEYADWCEQNGYAHPVNSNTLGKRVKAFENEDWFPLTEQQRTGVRRTRKWKRSIIAGTVRGKLANMALVQNDVA